MIMSTLGCECREGQESLARYCGVLFHIPHNIFGFFFSSSKQEKNPKQVKCLCGLIPTVQLPQSRVH